MRLDKSRVDLYGATKINRSRGIVSLVKSLITLLQEFLFLNARITMATSGENGNEKKKDCGRFSQERKISDWVRGANRSYSHGSILLRFCIGILSLGGTCMNGYLIASQH